MFTSTEVCRIAGITFRQLDHWTRRGVLRPRHAFDGSGSRREWPGDEVMRAVLCAVLARLGCNAVMQPAIDLMDGIPADLWWGYLVVGHDGIPRLCDRDDLADRAEGGAVVVSLDYCRAAVPAPAAA